MSERLAGYLCINCSMAEFFRRMGIEYICQEVYAKMLKRLDKSERLDAALYNSLPLRLLFTFNFSKGIHACRLHRSNRRQYERIGDALIFQ